MASVWIYILLGIVQGILEWLPVSSEGQLVLISLWFSDITIKESLTLAFWLHLGTMFAVLVYYRNEWLNILNLSDPTYYETRKFLIIATFGTGLVGIPIRLLFIDVVNWQIYSNLFMLIIGIALLFTAGLIAYTENTKGIKPLENQSGWVYLSVGIAQGFSIIPGISRSGTTISALLLFQINPEDSFRGSFLLAVPASLGAVFLDVVSHLVSDQSLIGSLNIINIFVGIFFAFLFGILTIEGLLQIVDRYEFSKVTFALGVFIIVLSIIML